MTKRQAPYRHADKSNCWTKNCSRKNIAADTVSRIEAQRKLASQMGENFVHVDTIAPIEDFYFAARNGDLNRQTHPEFPYSIFKYSQITQFSKNWNDITLASRGLIINDETGEIVARPFSKFFNHSEHATPPELMTGPVVIAEKMDGSLGISFLAPDGSLRISTAGGFSSEQAAHAQKIYDERYEGNWKPRRGTTYMWEIIYPANRIVVNYGDEDDIHLLGAVNIRTGKSIPLKELKEWKWKRATEYPEMDSIQSALAAPDRENHEGYIAHFTDTDARVKFKHEEYLRIHRFATNVNSRRIWEMMAAGDDIDQYRVNVPEEFDDYVVNTRKELQTKFDARVSEIKSTYSNVLSSLPKDVSQKDFAQAVNKNVPSDLRGGVFSLHSRGELGNAGTKSVWDYIKPEHEKGFWASNNGKTNDDE